VREGIGVGDVRRGVSVGCNEAVALIEETELLGRFEMQLLLEVLARAAAKLVKDVIISLAL